MKDWEKKRQAETAERIWNDSTPADDGALYWINSGNPVPVDCFKDAGLVAPEAQQAACSEHAAKVIARYIKQREEHGYSSEERAEMRAEFGDAPVTDVVTGRRIQ